MTDPLSIQFVRRMAQRVAVQRFSIRVHAALRVQSSARPDRAQRILNEVAERRRRPVGSIAKERLMLRGTHRCVTVMVPVSEARLNAGLDADEAMTLAVDETRRVREGHEQ